ncbi:MAG: DUF2497 domain-containing protein [Rickettsiaceae bacterium]|nr:MAG: DUF2497 domain-containing protein [Rickettsiaceae bacterium]
MSIEEILKSIRGIISNRENKEETLVHKNEDEDILELTEVIENISNLDNQQKGDQPINNETLISEATQNETSNFFKQFVKTAKISAQEAKKVKSLTIEEMVAQMMRPQLKVWLDKNLPLLVKELVEKEIKKLVENIEGEE